MKLDLCKIIDIPTVIDERGNLCFLEENKNVPFTIRRVYYLYNIPDKFVRGSHAHKELNQIIIPLSGSFNLLLDDGYSKKEYTLSSPNQGIFITNEIWRDLSFFSQGAVALILASLPYSAEDYIRNYDEFLEYVHGKEKV